jgi:MFS transporter, UMF1 family
MKVSNLKIFTWSLYDFANTIFSMMVVTLNFGLMVKIIYHGSELSLSLTRSSSMILVALSMPLAGVVADKYMRRMPLTIFFTILCCVTTIFIGKSSSLMVELILFGLALYCYQAALVFYDAVLPQLTTPDRIGRVSGYGVALGYVGTIFALLVVGSLAGPRAYSKTFTLTGILFFLFSIPFFLTVKDDAPKPLEGVWQMTWDSIKKMKDIYIDAKSREGILRFFIARFFIVDALETIIFFMAIFLTEAIGFKDNKAVVGNLSEIYVFLTVVTIFTVAGSLLWGFITEKFGPRNSLIGTVILWVITLSFMIFLSNKFVFYILGSLAGISLGGVWTTERPLLINLVNDNERLAGYFGIFALTGRMAAVIGPNIWSLTLIIFGPLGIIKYRFAVGSVLAMMITGLWILRKVPDAR